MEAKLLQPGNRRFPKDGKKLIPPKLNLNQKRPLRRRGSRTQQEDFDCRPFSFIDTDPMTPGFDPITPFEITPPQSPEGRDAIKNNHNNNYKSTDYIDDDDDDDDVIIDSPAPTPGFYNKMRDAIPEEDESQDIKKSNENEFISKQLGFSNGDFHKRSSFRDMSNLRKKSLAKRMSQSHNNKRDTTMTVFTEDNRMSVMSTGGGEEPFTPFADVDHFDHEEVAAPPKPLIPGFAPVQTTRFVATELVCPVPTHPTPLSPTMERFLARMQEHIQTPASAMFPASAKLMPTIPMPPSPEAPAMSSHVIDINLASVVAMVFSTQGMTDITPNQALVLQESDPLMDQTASAIASLHTYIIPIVLNNVSRHCSCTAQLTEEERDYGMEPAMHPNNILRFEGVIVQVRLAPRPRVKRHGWTFLNIGIPTRVALGVMESLERDLVSIGKCKMVLHGDYYWIYTPVRAYTKIYRRSPRKAVNLVKQRRASDVVPDGYYNEDDSDFFEETDEEEELEEEMYQELSDADFYSLLDGRSLEVDLYAEVYAKSQTSQPIRRASEGDFSLGVSIREIIVTGDAVVRGPEWTMSKSQRHKCTARGHKEVDALSPAGSSFSSPTTTSPLSALSGSSTNATSPGVASPRSQHSGRVQEFAKADHDMDHTPKPEDYKRYNTPQEEQVDPTKGKPEKNRDRIKKWGGRLFDTKK